MAKGSQQTAVALGVTSLACHKHLSFEIATPWCRDLFCGTHGVGVLPLPLSLHAHDLVLAEQASVRALLSLHHTFVP